jgi:tubulin polyglutamylase TTLL4
LWRNLVRSKRSFPRDFDFIPNTYLLASPSDWERFTAKRDQAGKDQIWIMKPVSSACGRGIKVICKKTKVAKRRDYLVCEYVTNPHLINGLKYDLRIYVLVSSYDPLRIYIFNDGLARFATEKYTTSIKELSKRYVHLTNWSVNKNSKNFVKNRDSVRI